MKVVSKGPCRYLHTPIDLMFLGREVVESLYQMVESAYQVVERMAAMSEWQDEQRPFSEFRHRGVLWAVNKTLFHPRGYALAFHYEDDAQGDEQPTGWSVFGNGSEVWTMTEEMDDRDFASFEALLEEVRQTNV